LLYKRKFSVIINH